jgi:hypothetical protein
MSMPGRVCELKKSVASLLSTPAHIIPHHWLPHPKEQIPNLSSGSRQVDDAPIEACGPVKLQVYRQVR